MDIPYIAFRSKNAAPLFIRLLEQVVVNRPELGEVLPTLGDAPTDTPNVLWRRVEHHLPSPPVMGSGWTTGAPSSS